MNQTNRSLFKCHNTACHMRSWRRTLFSTNYFKLLLCTSCCIHTIITKLLSIGLISYSLVIFQQKFLIIFGVLMVRSLISFVPLNPLSARPISTQPSSLLAYMNDKSGISSTAWWVILSIELILLDTFLLSLVAWLPALLYQKS